MCTANLSQSSPGFQGPRGDLGLLLEQPVGFQRGKNPPSRKEAAPIHPSCNAGVDKQHNTPLRSALKLTSAHDAFCCCLAQVVPHSSSKHPQLRAQSLPRAHC